MRLKFMRCLCKEDANALVENVIVLPLIFIVIYFMIMTCFVMHDRSTLDAAAKRGAIYAAHCICNPNYATILSKSGSSKGNLDVKEGIESFTFTGVGGKIKPYRYIFTTSNLNGQVQEEVRAILEQTRIPWRKIDVDDIRYTNINKIYYQDVTVSISARYPLPRFFGAFGLDTEYEYKVSAGMTVNDPDEFIRNADLVVDLIVEIDHRTGGHLSNALDKVKSMGSKVGEWLEKFKVVN